MGLVRGEKKKNYNSLSVNAVTVEPWSIVQILQQSNSADQLLADSLDGP